MSRIKLLSTAALGAVLFASAGHAQTGMNQTLSDPVAPLPQQQQAARQLDAGTMQRDITSLLRQSEQAVAAGNWARANEYVERAQTTFLNTHALTGDARQVTGNMGSLGEAGRAISNRNRGEAMRALQMAMGEMGRVGGDMGAGSGAGMAPAQSGAMMHDRGMGSSTMNRADAVGVLPRPPRSGVVLAQGGGGGGSAGEGSGGLQGSSRGSPGVGQQGSTPAVRPETPQQPGQTSALPGANAPGGAGASSAPGAGAPGAPRPGSGGVGVGTDQQGRTVTPTTPGGSMSR